jgi:hypothetical protein
MTAPALSPEAQQVFDELLRPVFLDGGDFFQDYYAMLEGLASEEVADPDDVKINDMSHADWKARRQEIRIAQELQQHATAILRAAAATAAAVAKLPPQASLEAFLELLMPDTGREVRRDRFNLFLTHEAEMEVDEQLKLFPKGLTREESIARMVQSRLATLKHADIPALSQYDLQEPFRRWWKSQNEGNPLGTINVTKKAGVSDRHAALAELLPSKPDKPGMSKKDWRSAAEKKGLISSPRVFNRDVVDMVRKGLVQDQENGCFRQPKK